MGSRGSFVDVDKGDFSFKVDGQHYKSVGALSSNPNVKVIIQDSSNVKAPEFSHSPNRIYAIVKDGILKHLAFYDINHAQDVAIDLRHSHRGVQPHRHVRMNHSKKEPGVPPTEDELKLIEQIKKEFHLK